ncbi:MAG: DNA topology modulation protein FlaR [Acidimicrobiales bacterium]
MQRVAVVGPGGAGKTTFARELADRTGLPVIHLDEHFWKPGWEPTARGEWRSIQEDLLAADSWIADGNYGGTFDIRLARADTVIVFAISRARCVLRAARRSLRNRGRAVQAPGCPERLDREFLRWIWRYPKDSKPRLDTALDEHAQHAEVITFHTSRDVRKFLRRYR